VIKLRKRNRQWMLRGVRVRVEGPNQVDGYQGDWEANSGSTEGAVAEEEKRTRLVQGEKKAGNP